VFELGLLENRGEEHLPQDEQDQQSYERREVDHAGLGYEAADRRDDRLGELNEDLRDRVAHAPVEPRHNSPGDDRELHDRDEGQQDIENERQETGPFEQVNPAGASSRTALNRSTRHC
jgi:hypothetical protein